MRSVCIIIALLLDRLAKAFNGQEEETFLPKEFLEKVLREMPDQLFLEVVGPSLITCFGYYAPTGDGLVYRTSLYQEEGVMPSIYRALLHVGAENKGIIKDPYKILADNHGALREYLGERQALAAISARVHGKPDEYPEA